MNANARKCGAFCVLLDILKQGGHKRNAVNTGFLYAYGG